MAADNATYTSYNGMLLNAASTDLISVPEGMKGAAVLPESIATVPAYVFSRCTKLPAISVAGSTGSQSFVAQNGILYTSDMTTLVAAPPALGATAAIAADCAVIAEGAFWGNNALTTIVVNGNVENIATNSDYEPVDLAIEGSGSADATVPAFMPQVIEGATICMTGEFSRAAWEAAGFTKFTEPAEPGSESADENGLVYTLLDDYTLSVHWAGDEDAPEQLSIPAQAEIDGVSYDVSTLAEGAFANQSSLKAIELPDTLTTIGARALQATGLEALTLPANVDSLGEASLADNAQLTALNVNAGLHYIEDYALQASGLDCVVLPASIMAVGDYAFANSPNLEKIVCEGTIASVGASALAGCTGVSIYVPYNEDESYAWNAGLPTEGNHVLPYGVKIAEESYELQTGESVNLFEDGGYLLAPEGIEASFSYKANPMKIDDEGTVTALAKGSSNVEVTLSMEDDSALAENEAGVQTGVVSLASASTMRLASASTAMTLSAAPQAQSAEPVALAEEGIDAQASLSEILTFTPLDDTTCKVQAKSGATLTGALVIPSSATVGTKSYTVTQIADFGFSARADSQGAIANGTAGLTSLMLPSTLNYIGQGAFKYCTNIVDISIANTTSNLTIGVYAFAYTSVTKLRIPASVTNLVAGFAKWTYSLQEYEVDPANKNYASLDGVIYNKNYSRLIAYPLAKADAAFSVPTTVATLGATCFQDVSALTAVYIPNSVTTLEDAVFRGMTNLADIWCYGSPTLNESTLDYANGTSVYEKPIVHCLSSEKSKWEALNPRPKTIDIIDNTGWFKFTPIDDSTCMVEAASGVTLSGALIIPETAVISGKTYKVTQIADYGFSAASDSQGSINRGTIGLTSVMLPKTLTVIGTGAFKYCSNVVDISISNTESNLSILVYAFSLTGVAHLNLPASVAYLGSGFAKWTENLQSYEVDNDNPRYKSENGILYNKDGSLLIAYPQAKSDTVISIPSTVKTLGATCFQDARNIETVYIPDSVQLIGDGVFRQAESLKEIWSYGTPELDESTLDYANLSTVSELPITVHCLASEKAKWQAIKPRPKTIDIIDNTGWFKFTPLDDSTCMVEAADGVTLSGALVIPSTATINGKTYKVTRIADHGFSARNDSQGSIDRGTIGLTSVMLPSSLTRIGFGAFKACTNITNITIANTESALYIDTYAFSYTAVTNLRLPASVTSVGAGFAKWTNNLATYEVDENNPSFSAQNGVLYNKSATVLVQYPIAKTDTVFSIPSTVRRLALCCFQDAINLETIYVPDSVEYMEDAVFRGTTNLKEIWSYGNPILTTYTLDYASSITVYENPTVYCLSGAKARWEALNPRPKTIIPFADLYTVVFHGNEGTNPINYAGNIPGIQTVQGSGKVVKPSDPTRTGYTFGGWFTTEACTGTAYNFTNAVVTNNVSLYAKWTPINYTITATTGGGAVSGWTAATANQTYTRTYTIETATFALPDATRVGCTFTGWTGASGAAPTTATKGYQIARGSTGNKSFVANWTVDEYTVKFASGVSGETITMPADIKTKVDASPKTKYPAASAVTRTGYTLSGWKVGSATYTPGADLDLTALLTAAGTAVTNRTVTLTAVWTEQTYTIQYAASTGSNAGGTVSAAQVANIKYTATTTLPAASTAKLKGRTLVKWAVNADETGTSYEPGATGITPKALITAGATVASGNVITLYTKWDWCTYTIKYDNNSAAATGDASKVAAAPADTTFTYQNVTGTTKKNLATMSATTGYTFGGWTKGSESFLGSAQITELIFTDLFGAADSGANATVTLSAKWSPKTFTFTWNDAQTPAKENTTAVSGTAYNAQITLPTAAAVSFSKSGYDIASWKVGSATGTAAGAPGAKVYVYDVVNQLASVSGTQVTLYADWQPSDATANVEYYYQKTDGTYAKNAADTVSVGGKTDQEIDLATLDGGSKMPATRTSGDYAYKRIDHADQVLKATMDSANPPTFKVYYALQLKVTLDSGTKSEAAQQDITGIDLKGTLSLATVDEPAPAKAQAYQFAGWKKTAGEPADTKIYTTAELKARQVLDNETFTAQWVAIQYKVTYAADDAGHVDKLPVFTVADSAGSSGNTRVYTYADFYDEASDWAPKTAPALAAQGSAANQAGTGFGYYLSGWCKDGDASASPTFTADFTQLFGADGAVKAVTVKGAVGQNSYTLQFWRFSGSTADDELLDKVRGLQPEAVAASAYAFPTDSQIAADQKIYGYSVSDWRAAGTDKAWSAGHLIDSVDALEQLVVALNGGSDIEPTAENHAATFDLYVGWALQYMVAVPVGAGVGQSNEATLRIDTGMRTAQTTGDVKVESFTARDVKLAATPTMDFNMKELAKEQFLDGVAGDVDANLGKIKFIYDGRQFAINGADGTTGLSTTLAAAYLNSENMVESNSYAEAMMLSIDSSLAQDDPDFTDQVWKSLQNAIIDYMSNNALTGTSHKWGDISKIVWTVDAVNIGGAWQSTDYDASTGEYGTGYTFTFSSAGDTAGTLAPASSGESEGA